MWNFPREFWTMDSWNSRALPSPPWYAAVEASATSSVAAVAMRASRARQAVRRAEAELVQSGSQSDWTNTPVDSCLSLTNCFVGETRHSARRGQRELVRDAHRHGWHSPRLLKTFSAGWRLQRANRVLPEPAEFNGSGKQRRIRRGMHEGSKDNRRAAYRNKGLGYCTAEKARVATRESICQRARFPVPPTEQLCLYLRHGSCPVRFENRSLRRHSFYLFKGTYDK